MASTGQTYVIMEGVRRAKAHQMAGIATIRAVIQDPAGTCGGEIEVAIDSLLSPKPAIDLTIPSEPARFCHILAAVQAGRSLRPITIAPGSRGTIIKDVGFIQ